MNPIKGREASDGRGKGAGDKDERDNMVEWGSTERPLRQVLRVLGGTGGGEEGQKLQRASKALQVTLACDCSVEVQTVSSSEGRSACKEFQGTGGRAFNTKWDTESQRGRQRYNRRTHKSQWVGRAWGVCYGYHIVANNEEKTETLGRKSKYCVLHVELGNWVMAGPS